ncbi:MAG TPA: methyltransferase domain-containing protein [Thermomicrobiales bacterium]|nr:methyltransferase domain-containing protein [Thermomicrobiales bacterium]
MRKLYTFMYRVGFVPWEMMQNLPIATQISTLFDREEAGRQPPYGRALDLGCGSGIWSVKLATRGWDVTGVDFVPKALRRARKRAQAAGVDVRFVHGDAAQLDSDRVGSGFRLVIDFGAIHGLTPAQREAVGRNVSAVATPDASVMILAAMPGHRGPLPSGMSRDEIETAFQDWRVVDEQPCDMTGAPGPIKNMDQRFYRLRRN